VKELRTFSYLMHPPVLWRLVLRIVQEELGKVYHASASAVSRDIAA
jgi:hypothetical protein